jgi:hypothetical protein
MTNSMMHLIKIENRKGELLCQLDGVSAVTTVEDFKEMVVKECDYIKKRKLSVHRLRFTVKNEDTGAQGVALSDKTKTLKDYF